MLKYITLISQDHYGRTTQARLEQRSDHNFLPTLPQYQSLIKRLCGRLDCTCNKVVHIPEETIDTLWAFDSEENGRVLTTFWGKREQYSTLTLSLCKDETCIMGPYILEKLTLPSNWAGKPMFSSKVPFRPLKDIF